jgi:hypothetical protein
MWVGVVQICDTFVCPCIWHLKLCHSIAQHTRKEGAEGSQQWTHEIGF